MSARHWDHGPGPSQTRARCARIRTRWYLRKVRHCLVLLPPDIKNKPPSALYTSYQSRTTRISHIHLLSSLCNAHHSNNAHSYRPASSSTQRTSGDGERLGSAPPTVQLPPAGAITLSKISRKCSLHNGMHCARTLGDA